MKVKYLAFRTGGIDMTGRTVEMDDEEAATLIKSNIVVPVETQVETASTEAPENAMRPQSGRKHVAQNRGHKKI